MNNSTTIALMEAHSVVQSLSEGSSVEDKLRCAMGKTVDHWLALTETEKFNAAVGAVLLESTDVDKARIEHEVQMLRLLQAATSGVPVDFSALTVDEDLEPIGLIRLWDEAKARQ